MKRSVADAIGLFVTGAILLIGWVLLTAWIFVQATGYLHQDFPAIPAFTMQQALAIYFSLAFLFSPLSLALGAGKVNQ